MLVELDSEPEAFAEGSVAENNVREEAEQEDDKRAFETSIQAFETDDECGETGG